MINNIIDNLIIIMNKITAKAIETDNFTENTNNVLAEMCQTIVGLKGLEK